MIAGIFPMQRGPPALDGSARATLAASMLASSPDSRPGIDLDAIEARLLALVAERGPDKSICPSDVARAMAGTDTAAWGPLMTPIRKIAVRLASEGRIVILRKGKPVDPLDFKGVYRLSLPRSD